MCFVFQYLSFHFDKLREILDPADMDFCVNFDSYRNGITEWINYLREENTNNRSAHILSILFLRNIPVCTLLRDTI